MPTTINQGNIIEVTYGWTLGVQRGLNVVHYLVGGTLGLVTQLSEIATALRTAVDTKALAIVPAAVEFAGVSAQLIDPLPVSARWSGGGPTGPGTFAGVPGPKQVTMVVTKQTEFAGRSERGRCYVPFPSKDAEDTDGTPTDAYLLKVQDLYDYILGNLTFTVPSGGATLVPVIWHRESRTTTRLYAIRYNDKFGTQRRRGDYGRPN